METTRLAEVALKGHGWTEAFVGIWTHDLFDVTFDTNSDGVAVHDTEDMIDYISDGSSVGTVIRFVNEYNGVEHRNDIPF